MLDRIRNLVRKEAIQFLRHKLILIFVLVFPIWNLTSIASMVSRGIMHIPAAVYDQARSRASRQLIGTLRNSDVFDPDYHASSQAELERLLERGGGLQPATHDEEPGFPSQLQTIAEDLPDLTGAAGDRQPSVEANGNPPIEPVFQGPPLWLGVECDTLGEQQPPFIRFLISSEKPIGAQYRRQLVHGQLLRRQGHAPPAQLGLSPQRSISISVDDVQDQAVNHGQLIAADGFLERFCGRSERSVGLQEGG